MLKEKALKAMALKAEQKRKEVEALKEYQGKHAGELTEKETVRATELFHRVDVDSSGGVTASELSAVHGGDAEAAFAKLDSDSSGTTSLPEFLGFLREMKGSKGAKTMGFFLRRLEKGVDTFVEDRLEARTHKQQT